ncbi:putative nitronate monooxygenase [Vanrija pseudolonga]|uniref:Nitronate monooxygenase n=1 Tax=Vanrija pseudolonga TaxID=143232 RepID=A0AAF0YFM3_9TREE|nr:putative nitronate monooxygenase [Vanrija pseudolonga]
MSQQVLNTQLTQQFGITHPILLAGMFVASGPKLAAAVSNAGGLGVIGGLTMTPKQLRMNIKELKGYLVNKDAPFGVDLAIVKVGGGARKTNHDYTHGHLDELVDIIVEEKVRLFVCAIGVVPPQVADKLHKGGVVVANMVGHPKHVPTAIRNGADIVIAQGGEGGGHTGPIPFSVLIPACVDAARGHVSKLSGKPVMVLAAGGIFDGRGLAAALMYGAQGVWVGTRFVASEEASAPDAHKKQVVSADWGQTTTTLIYSGRPIRVKKTPYVAEWNDTRADEIKELTGRGIVPYMHDLEKNPQRSIEAKMWLMGDNAAVIKEVLPARKIVEDMANDAAKAILAGKADLAGARARL